MDNKRSSKKSKSSQSRKLENIDPDAATMPFSVASESKIKKKRRMVVTKKRRPQEDASINPQALTLPLPPKQRRPGIPKQTRQPDTSVPVSSGRADTTELSLPEPDIPRQTRPPVSSGRADTTELSLPEPGIPRQTRPPVSSGRADTTELSLPEPGIPRQIRPPVSSGRADTTELSLPEPDARTMPLPGFGIPKQIRPASPYMPGNPHVASSRADTTELSLPDLETQPDDLTMPLPLQQKSGGTRADTTELSLPDPETRPNDLTMPLPLQQKSGSTRADTIDLSLPEPNSQTVAFNDLQTNAIAGADTSILPLGNNAIATADTNILPLSNRSETTRADDLTVPFSPGKKAQLHPFSETSPALPKLDSDLSQIDHYQIIGKIGAGGMGAVYHAMDTKLQRPVAIKCIHRTALINEKIVSRFYREMQISASLNHRHIIKVYHIGKFDNVPYLVMEYIEGVDLASYLKQQKITLRQKLLLLEKVALALAYAHKHNIIHRDLKPANIMIRTNGEAVLMDFGVAKITQVTDKSLTLSGEIVGTPHFMSPEQARGAKREIDRRTDVYALGALLYFILLQKPPIIAATLTETLQRIVKNPPVPPRSIDATIPKSLERICLKALEKKKAHRYPSAKAFARDIRRFLQGRHTAADRFYRWQHLRRGALLVPAILLMAAVLIFAIWQLYRQHQHKLAVQAAWVEKNCMQAKMLCEQKKYQPALALLRQTVAKAPESSQLYCQMALVYQQLEDNDQARNYFARALRLGPENSELLLAKSIFHQKMQEYSQARQLLDRYLAKKPQDFAAYYRRAEIYHKLNQPNLAARDRQQARKLQELNLSDCLRQAQQHLPEHPHRALPLLDNLLQEFPDFEQAYWQRAWVYYRLQKLHQALHDISRVVEINPSVKHLLTKATWLDQAGYGVDAYETMRQAYKQSLKDNKKEGIESIEYLLGKLAEKIQAYKQAYDYYSRICSRKSIVRLQLQMGRVAFKSQQYDKALVHLKQAIRAAAPTSSAPDPAIYGEALYFRGQIYEKQNQKLLAVEDWRLAQQTSFPQYPDLLYRLGKIYYGHREFRKAIRCLEPAAQQLPDKAEVHALLGRCYLEDKQFHSAVGAFTRAIELRPWEYDYYFQRGMSFSSLANFEASESDFSICLKLNPYDMLPYVQIIEGIFKAGFLHNYRKIYFFMWLAQGTPRQIIRDAMEVDLYLSERQQLRKLLTSSQQRQEQRLPAIAPSAYRSFIHSLESSNSPAVQKLTQRTLLSMFRDPRLYRQLAAACHKATPAAQKRIGELMRQIVAKCSRPVQRLLLRRFAHGDKQAIREIYHLQALGQKALVFILHTRDTNPLLRFWAARALAELRQPEAEALLLDEAQSSCPEVQIFCQAAMPPGKLTKVSAQTITAVKNSKYAYARALAVKVLPFSNNELQRFLRDRELAVRLYAARRLRAYGDPAAEAELVRNFSNKSPLVRAFCHSYYWDLSGCKKHLSTANYQSVGQRARAHLPVLLKATDDVDPRVRLTAVVRLGQMPDKTYLSVFKKRLDDSDILTKLQAIKALAQLDNGEIVVSMLANHRELLIIRSFAVLQIYQSRKFHLPLILKMFKQLLSDPNPLLRFLIFERLGWSKKLGWSHIQIIQQLLMLHSKSDDVSTRSGCAVGMCNSSDMVFYKRLEQMVQDPSPRVRSLAAAGMIYITAFHDLARNRQLFARFRHAAPEIVTGASRGYVRLVRDNIRVPYQHDQRIWDWHEIYAQHIENMAIYPHENFRGKKLWSLGTEIAFLSRALDLDSKDPYISFERGILHFRAAKEKMGNRSLHLQKSRQDIERALALKPDYALFKKWLAAVCYLSGQHQYAAKLVKELLPIFPWDIRLWQLQAQILQTQGQKAEAARARARVKYLGSRP